MQIAGKCYVWFKYQQQLNQFLSKCWQLQIMFRIFLKFLFANLNKRPLTDLLTFICFIIILFWIFQTFVFQITADSIKIAFQSHNKASYKFANVSHLQGELISLKLVIIFLPFSIIWFWLVLWEIVFKMCLVFDAFLCAPYLVYINN